MSLLSPGGSGPKENVFVCAASAPAGGAVSRSLTSGVTSFGKPFSRIQTGRFGSARPGWSLRTENDPLDGWSPVKIVTARSGHVLVAAFSISSSRSLVCASRWSVGNFAALTSTGKSPAGSSASWRSASSPQAEVPEAMIAITATATPRARTPRGMSGWALVAISAPKARATYHRGLRPSAI